MAGGGGTGITTRSFIHIDSYPLFTNSNIHYYLNYKIHFMPDVFKILKDLELKAVGLDPSTNKMQEGYFVSFRSIGLPIHKDDFARPWTPTGGNLASNTASTPANPNGTDPAGLQPASASKTLDENKIAVANIAKSQQSFLNTFLLLDDKLVMSNDYSVIPGSSKINDSWFAIINGANAIPSNLELKDDIKAAFEKAKAKLMDKDGNPTPHYESYMRFEDEYKSKVRASNKAYANAFTDPAKLQMWPIEGKLYQDDISQAWDRWMGFGFKVEIENALATLAAQGTDPSILLIARAKKKYENSLVQFQNIGSIPYTVLLPTTWYDKDNDDGWNQYSSHDFHFESHYQASSTSYGGSVGANFLLWSASASFEHSESRQAHQANFNDLSITFQYCIVDIKRPWLDTSLLNLKNWFIVGDYKKNTISNGTMGQHKPDNAEPTFLPSIPVSFILIKDVRIKWSNWKSDFQAAQSSTSGGGSVGIGPFCASGHYSHHNQSRDFTCDGSGEELHIPGIQLLGYVSMINPACPAHDSSEFMQKIQTPAANNTSGNNNTNTGTAGNTTSNTGTPANNPATPNPIPAPVI
jgi:hypothetical protein